MATLDVFPSDLYNLSFPPQQPPSPILSSNIFVRHRSFELVDRFHRRLSHDVMMDTTRLRYTKGLGMHMMYFFEELIL